MTFDPARAPFHLDPEAADWVRATLAGMNRRQKLAQLLNVLVRTDDDAELARLQELGLGSITRNPTRDPEGEAEIRAAFDAAAPAPLLVSADLEGSRMTQPGGTTLPNPLGLAAIDDLAATEAATAILARDGRANGVNWSFTPLLDVNAAFRSAIVGTRSFGSDPDRVRRHALQQIATFQSNGVAATAKHWPSEGYDDRDQHLVTTVNPLSVEAWEATFGRLYRDAIAAGVLGVMVGHIAFPAFVRAEGDEAGAFLPATISRHLIQTLLRERLGFEGLIVSDATSMGGLGQVMPRRDFLHRLLTAGNDVILFSPDPAQDIAWLEEAVEDGRLGMDRVEDAVSRQLALKARLGLHRGPLPPLPRDSEADAATARELHARVPTLVKDRDGLFPVSPASHRRVLIVTGGIVFPFVQDPIPFALPEMMRARGFEVTLHEKGTPFRPADHDLVLYLMGEESLLTRGHIHVDWWRMLGDFGAAMVRPWHDVPTAMISFGHPYYLYDAARMPAYVNAYATSEAMQQAVLDAITGVTPFTGTSPVDPFCGREDTRL
ncbi:glycoside hydrolase family 3 protein [Wenxinia saemankumensis]|uniref:Beta-N-acetylhexosaminidase n=1 Tax=Wenxinia saemankumensis TaxID=1447782 RepID=A0A1M6DXR4_9RHOB|nr:glycoside hydrolase family 3 N-terminal domain-containing protein [Wenxinia saemankumensis]SHI78036.1 beta-N-acetylhexosaminidase [Wenxinia saemankumensis]